MAPTSMNPKGYFESDAIYRLHEEIFAATGTSWDDIRPFPQIWLKSSQAKIYQSRMQDLIRSEYRDSNLFVLKDPRICRMMPFWTELLIDMGVQPVIIHIHRNPLEVAASLNGRDQIDSDYGQYLWLCHILEAERGSRDLVRAFTSYETLLENWAGEVRRLGEALKITWPASFSPENSAPDSFIEPSLRRFKSQTESVSQYKWLRETYCILQRWVTHGVQSGDQKTLDTIRKHYISGVEAFGTIIQSRGTAIRTDRDNIRRKLSEKEASIASQKQKIDTLTQEGDILRGEINSFQDVLQKRTIEISDVRKKYTELNIDNENLQYQFSKITHEMQDLTDKFQHNEREYAKLSSYVTQCHNEIEKANSLRAELISARYALMQSHDKINSTVQKLIAIGESLGIQECRGKIIDIESLVRKLQKNINILHAAHYLENKTYQK